MSWIGEDAQPRAPSPRRRTAYSSHAKIAPDRHVRDRLYIKVGGLDRDASDESYHHTLRHARVHIDASLPKHPLAWRKYGGEPRVERSAKMSIFERAKETTLGELDSRAASVAYPKDVANDNTSLSVTLLDTLKIKTRPLSRSVLEQTSTPGSLGVSWLFDSMPPRAHQALATSTDARVPASMHFGAPGERNVLVDLRRLGKDLYEFDLSLAPGIEGNPAGTIRHRRPLRGKVVQLSAVTLLDSDTGLRAAEKMHELYPELLPAYVHMGDKSKPIKNDGDAANAYADPTRRTRIRLLHKGRLMDEHLTLREQCLAGSFNKYFG